MRLILAAILFLSVGRPAWAGELPPIPRLFEAPCRELGIPCPTAVAIAQVESGLHPWSLNIEGQGLKFKTRWEALARARDAWAADRSFDIGLMQVNSWWLKRYAIPLDAALDPLANIYLGGWILKSEIDRHKSLQAAVGAYHSPNPDRARRYASTVMSALERGPVKVPAGKAKPKNPTAQKRAAEAAAHPASNPASFDASPMTVLQKQPSSMIVSKSSSMKVRFKNQ
ncbi:MAG: lytic transglycosylase domain-containing protein [Candidatus Adiutrix sp.]|jgi:hypothetical protein|nr:lytic transglycosylase domain-containing protein [Candidatus Adiutrix sp.]